MKKMNITGRDRLIMCQALAIAIVAIERLPEIWRPRSNARDMQALLDAISGGGEHHLTMARALLARRSVATEDGKLVIPPRDDDPVVPIA
jgi:hypothetical protein